MIRSNRILFMVIWLAMAAFKNSPETRRTNLNMRVRSGMHCDNIPEGKKKVSEAAEPWTSEQLIAPADLAALINRPDTKKPVIICVGPGALIKGSLDTGPAKEKENLEKLRLQLSKLPVNTYVVIYCGCCPFEHCPNIRPAFNLLNEMKFNNAHLLNLEHNLKTDWIAKGYPQA